MSNEVSQRDFLVEIGTEELPPKALGLLSKSFQDSVKKSLEKEQLTFSLITRFATPRRLALLVTALVDKQADKEIAKFGPAVKAAYDEEGNPTKAALGFARSCGVDISELATADKDGVEKLSFHSTKAGRATIDLLPDIIANGLAQLPIPKRMRWGSSRVEFVRPVHWCLLLYGTETVNCEILGVESGNFSYGHRFHHNQKIIFTQPSAYESTLEDTGSVIPDFTKRKELIRQLIIEEGIKLGSNTVVDEGLLDEVTGLVEFPVALTGKFEEHFLEVPAEALILAMKSHQKCFYLENDLGELQPRFITVSNIRSKDPSQVIEGNERVIRPRLADARFFFETDKQRSLESRQDQLKKIVFQDKLGTVFEKSQRVAILCSTIANSLGENAETSARAALLSKCDLVTNMVGEFADLQGLMGSYYARADGEPDEIALALNEQYMPRYSGDSLPNSTIGAILAVADKLDTIVGLFAIGQPPTGSKDPFALRRAAIGILRILVEKKLELNLLNCIRTAVKELDHLQVVEGTTENVFNFMLERFRAWYLEKGISSEVFQSVMALKPEYPLDFDRRIQAVSHFSSLTESGALASANKRVSNLLAKLDETIVIPDLDQSLLTEEAEIELYKLVSSKKCDVAPLFESANYKEGLTQLVELKDSVDSFFDNVLVMSDDPAIRNNRIALLQQLRSLFLHVADISYLHRG